MLLKVNTYLPGSSPVHACDARAKIVLLAAYSVTLFLVDTWLGLCLCALAFAVVLGLSGIPPRRVFGIVAPVYVLVMLTVAFNAFSLDVEQAAVSGMAGAPNVGADLPSPLSSLPPVALIGSFGFVPVGFARGCFFAVRILLLVFASLVVSFTSTSTELADALAGFLSPLRRLRVPVDDIATVFSLALRFIPVTAGEFCRARDAQWARGAAFGEGSLGQRLRAWQTVFIPLFVSLFRRADALARAMDARCYGAPGVQRTSLSVKPFAVRSVLVLAVGLLLCVAVAIGC